jgi:hypothetical protein
VPQPRVNIFLGEARNIWQYIPLLTEEYIPLLTEEYIGFLYNPYFGCLPR